MIEVRVTEKMGRGVFAQENINKGFCVHQADFIKIKSTEFDICPTISKYVYSYSKKYLALCLGVGSLFNHSDKPNIEACFSEKDGREIMEFVALKNIQAGEQLFISYGGEEYVHYDSLKK